MLLVRRESGFLQSNENDDGEWESGVPSAETRGGGEAAAFSPREKKKEKKRKGNKVQHEGDGEPGEDESGLDAVPGYEVHTSPEYSENWQFVGGYPMYVCIPCEFFSV